MSTYTVRRIEGHHVVSEPIVSCVNLDAALDACEVSTGPTMLYDDSDHALMMVDLPSGAEP